MHAHATALLPVEEESRAESVHRPGETEEPFAERVFREQNPEPGARLPGEAEEPSLTEGLRESSGAPAPDTGELLPASARRWWKRRQTLLLGAAVIALGTAGASAFFASPYPVPQMASTMRHWAGEMGIRRAEPLAPAASLAGVPTAPAEPVTREKHQPKRKDQQLQELLALLGGAAESQQSVAQSANGPPASPATGRDSHPGDRDAPPPGYVPSEPGSNPASAASPTKPVRGLGAHAAGSVAAPGVQPSAEATGAASPSPAAAAPVPAAGEPPHDATAAVLASLGQASKPAESSPPSPRPPTEQTGALSPAAESGKHGDPVETAGELRAAPLTPADQVQVLELVTQMAAMVRDLRAQHTQLRADFGKTAADNVARLADFERRLALAEARHALSAAQIAGEPLASLPSASAPAGEAPTGAGSGAGQAGSATAVKAPVVVTPAALPGSDKGPAKRYRVQAASPGLALLAEIDRGGGDGAQLEVLVGDAIPGYGKITSIAQRGTAWVVRTEHGNIQ